MASKSLSSEISSIITDLKKLKARDPNNQQLIAQTQEMYDALQQAQGKEWEEQVDKYRDAKKALDAAKNAAQIAINDLSKTADTIEKTAKALKAVLAALALVL